MPIFALLQIQMKMEDNGPRYINPLTDFGFKRIFGTPFNKDLLIDFLNALLEGEREISDVTYRNGEQLGASRKDRRAVFDVYCQATDGSRFIVEMQNMYQPYFKDRSIYYSTFLVAERDSVVIGTTSFNRFIPLVFLTLLFRKTKEVMTVFSRKR